MIRMQRDFLSNNQYHLLYKTVKLIVQVRVQARNAHGWGGFSNNFTFSTRASGAVPNIILSLYFLLPKIQNEMFDIPGDIPKELPVEVHSSGITGKPLLLGTCTGSKAKYQYILFASLQLLKNEDYLIYIVLALLLHCWLVWSWKCEDEGFKSLKSNNETFID